MDRIPHSPISHSTKVTQQRQAQAAAVLKEELDSYVTTTLDCFEHAQQRELSRMEVRCFGFLFDIAIPAQINTCCTMPWLIPK